MSAANAEITNAIEVLNEAIRVELEANDLGRLARMHTQCQLLVQAGGEVGQLATALGVFLEAVILNEANDAQRGLAVAPKAIAGLAAVISGQTLPLGDFVTELKLAATGADSTSSKPAQESAAPAQPAEQTKPTTPVAAATAPMSPAAEAKPASNERYVSEPLVIDMSEREHLQGFTDEAREHMDAIESALLNVERDPGNADKINELFRPFHTIKGIAGFLNLRDINRLTHEVETILDLGRRHELTITPAAIDVIFTAIDSLKLQLAELVKYLAAPTGGPVPQPDIVDIMSRLRRVQRSEEAGAAAPLKPSTPEAATTGTTASPASSRAAAATGGTASAPADTDAKAADLSIRVDTQKLDSLVDAVGELVIAQTMVNLNQKVRLDEKLVRDVSQVTKIVRDIQETAMAMRMVPIGPMFQKMKRVVRDVARKAGKQVDMEITGEDVELDKNVAQAISDPLVHMVRNAVDHGIEPPDARPAAGKPPTGTVRLKAYYQGDTVVIEIVDDGRGLDREKLRRKAIERGVITADAQLDDQEIYKLIFEAGFSTAEQITDISGRGVGMDVVRRNIEALRGKIEIETVLGQGSTFRIRLPLTLAIIDGMLVRCGSERLIIPTILIEQSLRPARDQITVVQRRGEMIQVRGEMISLLQLGCLFGYSTPVDPTEALVVIVQAGSQKVGVVCDELIGQQQVVIKALSEQFKQVRGISGAAILGDGRVGLILEPTGLLQLHNAAASISGSTMQRAKPSVEQTVTAADQSDLLVSTQ